MRPYCISHFRDPQTSLVVNVYFLIYFSVYLESVAGFKVCLLESIVHTLATKSEIPAHRLICNDDLTKSVPLRISLTLTTQRLERFEEP